MTLQVLGERTYRTTCCNRAAAKLLIIFLWDICEPAVSKQRRIYITTRTDSFIKQFGAGI
jgi:hypothetical protein